MRLSSFKKPSDLKNPDFADDQSIALTWSDTIFIMLHDHARWKEFTSRPIIPNTAAGVMLSLPCKSRHDVDAVIELAENAGAQIDINPVIDDTFMYIRSWTDHDGHIWEAVCIKK